MVNQAKHAHNIRRAQAHEHQRFLVQRSYSSVVNLVQLLHCNVKTLPLGAKNSPERPAADASAHDNRRSAFDVRHCPCGKFVCLAFVTSLFGGCLAVFEKRDELRRVHEQLQQAVAGRGVCGLRLQHAGVAKVDLAGHAGGRQQRARDLAVSEMNDEARQHLR
jgi:hypothetical protein